MFAINADHAAVQDNICCFQCGLLIVCLFLCLFIFSSFSLDVSEGLPGFNAVLIAPLLQFPETEGIFATDTFSARLALLSFYAPLLDDRFFTHNTFGRFFYNLFLDNDLRRCLNDLLFNNNLRRWLNIFLSYDNNRPSVANCAISANRHDIDIHRNIAHIANVVAINARISYAVSPVAVEDQVPGAPLIFTEFIRIEPEVTVFVHDIQVSFASPGIIDWHRLYLTVGNLESNGRIASLFAT